jgi:hypothetical protein
MVLPTPIKQAYTLWMRFAHVLGRIMSFILLTVLWIVVFGVYAIILKIIRRCTRTVQIESYWIDVSREATDLRYQF